MTPTNPNASKQVKFREILIRIATIAVPLLLLNVIGKFFAKEFAAIVMLLIGASASFAASKWFVKITWPSKWRLLRRARKVGKYLDSPPIARMFYLLCIVFATTSFALGGLFTAPNILIVGQMVSIMLLFVAVVIDYYIRLRTALRFKTFHFFARYLGYFFAAITVFLATVGAKHLTHAITNADPAAFTEFVRLTTALIYPFALIIVFATLLFASFLLQYLFLTLVMLVIFPLRSISSFFVPNFWENTSNLSYRIFHGHYPDKTRSFWLKFFDGIENFLRPLGVFILSFFLFFSLTSSISFLAPFVEKYAQYLLVTVEFKGGHFCKGIAPESKIVYLANNYVSIATTSNDGYNFSIAKCNID